MKKGKGAHKDTHRHTDKDQGKFAQKPEKAGLLVTGEFDKAVEDCKAKVARISQECRTKNRKFRDVEFDLDIDREICLLGVDWRSLNPNGVYNPADVQRVTQIFDKPQFFVDGAQSNDIVQGNLGDCWFLSALATLSGAPGLVEKFCVARDEQVGVYGFIFFRDSAWVTVIIDDLLYTAIPKFEELSASEKVLYHNDKDIYNRTARKGGKSLCFAKSGTPGETWVPLIEKAYAKLHGDYESLNGGYPAEAIEDLTGGVSTVIQSKDILDPDRFWKEELLNVNQDRLFGCYFDDMNPTRSGEADIRKNGLIGSHAYSVLRAVEYKGKKFVVVRNPWGSSEWTGAWSDGSKEWNEEWFSALSALGHVFGEDGQFVMEYHDFLANFEQIERTRLFDSNWAMSSQWLEVQARPLPSAWSYGDVCFTLSLEKPTSTVIVLALLDDRYYRGINGRSNWSFDFVLFRRGEPEPLAGFSSLRPSARSGNLDVDLDAGEYIIHVRLDRSYCQKADYFENASQNWNERKLSRVLSERAKSQLIASNFKKELQSGNIPVPLSELAGRDLNEKREADEAAARAHAEESEDLEYEDPDVEAFEENITPEDMIDSPRGTVTKTIITKKVIIVTSDGERRVIRSGPAVTETQAQPTPAFSAPQDPNQVEGDDGNKDVEDVDKHEDGKDGDQHEDGENVEQHEDGKDDDKHEDGKDEDAQADFRGNAPVPFMPHDPVVDIWSYPNSLVLGLRVYTHKDAVAVIGGQVYREK